MNKRLVVIAPHCDDAEIGCGGYIARCVDRGAKVKIVVIVSGRYHHTDMESDYQHRVDMMHEASKVLGVTDVGVLLKGFQSALNIYPMGKLVGKLETIISGFGATEVILPLPSCHQDHDYVWRICGAVFRPHRLRPGLNSIMAYEYPMSGWLHGVTFNHNLGHTYVDITEYIDTKLEAVGKYYTQLTNGSLLSLDAIKLLAETRGTEVGVHFAERFTLLKALI